MLTKGTLNDTEQGGHLIILPTTCCKSACLYQQYESIMVSHFCDPMDHGPPGTSVHGVLQPRILEWVAMPPPGDLPDPGIEPTSPASPALQEDSLSLSHHESIISSVIRTTLSIILTFQGISLFQIRKLKHREVRRGCTANRTGEARHFPAGPVAKSPRSQSKGPWFNPWSGN